jgi:hypothetical protein
VVFTVRRFGHDGETWAEKATMGPFVPGKEDLAVVDGVASPG